MNEKFSVHEKHIFISLVTSVIILAAYSVYVYHNYFVPNPLLLNDFKFWGKAFLYLILVSIIAQLIIHIIFAIINKILTNEEIPMVSDERDKLIELKTIRISHWIFLAGFLLAMASQAFGMQHWVFFITLIYSGFLAAIISESIKIYYYRKGI
jgi:cell division protein FtsL